jgi:uncharacterized protein
LSEIDLIIGNLPIPIEKDGVDQYLKAASLKMKIEVGEISIKKILSKNLDLRDQKQFFYRTTLAVTVNDSYENKQQFKVYIQPLPQIKNPSKLKSRPIIIGFGPAGMFAALELIEHGYKPIIFERGKNIEDRTIDVEKFIETGVLNSESNIQFGEGGAGSYSDGKLFSRRHNNTSYVNKVLKTFVKFGAPQEIEYISKPHLGTDILCKIVSNIRLHILKMGGDIYYGSKMTDILISGGKAWGVVINGAKEYLSSHIYVAVGHSARDTFEMMHEKGVFIEQKNISVGLRVEHPVKTIDLMRYGKKYVDYSGLGAATYSLNYTNRKIKRGVYTFCMCPGGEVVNASSSDGLLVVNGMSYSKRDSAFSNAALVVSCHGSDYKSTHPLAGMEFQKNIEKKAFEAGGKEWRVPGQNLMDFLGEETSGELNKNSYKMGTTQADMREIFPPFIINELVSAFKKWKDQVPLFISNSAILLGAETRTSSPVKTLRSENYESINIKNIYFMGEGSGYTGGITSSAADAIKSVERTLNQR